MAGNNTEPGISVAEMSPSVVSLRLDKDWIARVLVGYAGVPPQSGLVPHLPGEEDWRELLNRFIADPEGVDGREVLKCSNKGEVFLARLTWLVVRGDEEHRANAAWSRAIDVVCKRTASSGLGRRMLGPFRRSRERIQFGRAFILLRSGIATAWPLALLERRRPSREAWLITAFVPDLVDLDRLVLTILPGLSSSAARQTKDAVITAVAGTFCRLFRYRLHHRDMKASNILLSGWEDPNRPTQVWLLDLEGLQRRRPWRRRSWQPVIRLAASLLGYNSVTRTDNVRFLKSYLRGRDRTDASWKGLYICLSRHAQEYLRKAQSRKTHKLDAYTTGT